MAEPLSPKGFADAARRFTKSFKGGDEDSHDGMENVMDMIRQEDLTNRPDLLGKISRSPITGNIKLRILTNVCPDFCIVDLASRIYMCNQLKELAEDPYLFRMEPMAYRSWIYHRLVVAAKGGTKEAVQKALPTSSKLSKLFDEHEIIKQALSYNCVDVPNVTAGRQSPLMYWLPALFGFAVAGDNQVLVGMLVMVTFLAICTLVSNMPEGYRLFRPLTFPIRLGATGFIVSRVMRLISSGSTLGILGNLTALGFALMDIYLGDITAVSYIKRTCSYTVERALPNRVFLCRRHGDAVYHTLYKPRQEISQKVSGMGRFGPEYILIGEIRGIICSLRPVELDEWQELQQAYFENSHAPPFCGLDIFNEEVPDVFTLDAMELQMKKQKALADHLKDLLEQSGHDHTKDRVFVNNSFEISNAESKAGKAVTKGSPAGSPKLSPKRRGPEASELN